MSGRGGRDLQSSRRDHPPSGRSNAPPSRHLWVGNLLHDLSEPELARHFLRFGELDSVAFQPGRSYAFVNFLRDDDAIAAMKALQGFAVAGNQLRIEFAKADKSSTPSADEEYLQFREEQRTSAKGSPFSQRDSRARHASPDTFNPEKSKTNDRSAEPSEVLWIGFPALLKVDEVILRKAFSPFGEIDKITVFPGRSYAFVRFKSLVSACRAKRTLQGKLFGNPRVHICFAKSESGPSHNSRGSTNASLSPHSKFSGRQGFENSLYDRNSPSFTEDPGIRSYGHNFDSGDSDVYSVDRKGSLWSDAIAYEPWRSRDLGHDRQLQHDMYERRESPLRFHDFPQKYPQKTPLYEEPWDMPEDPYASHGAKRLRIGSFPPDKELPEYLLSEFEQEKHTLPKMRSDFPQSEAFDKNYESGTYRYKQIHDRVMTMSPLLGERRDNQKPVYDDFHVGPGSLPSNLGDRKRFTPEFSQPSLKEWKWEGTIAKGGTPVCCARCFPVGKVLDIMLPDFLDCTARTSLDMLAKHYYQAAGTWVVFFVPGSDADMGFYNEFMNYLGEKQRAAVAKLDEKNTLFLVPPSEFSEKVLKVPGKLSISGVILRLEHPTTNFGSVNPSEMRDTNLLLFHGDASQAQAKPSTPPGSYHSHPELSKSATSEISYRGPATISITHGHAIRNTSDCFNESRNDHLLHRHNPTSGPNTSPEKMHSVSLPRNMQPQVSRSVDPTNEGHHSVIPRAVQETSSSNYIGGVSGIPSGDRNSSLQESKPSLPLSMPITNLQPELLAQLASSLQAQQMLMGNSPNISGGENYQQSNTMDQTELLRWSNSYVLQNNQLTPELFTPQHTQQLQQQQQQTANMIRAMPSTVQGGVQPGIQSNQKPQSSGTQEEADADTQKRLQATLQLAAALLQQIQEGKGT